MNVKRKAITEKYMQILAKITQVLLLLKASPKQKAFLLS